MPAPPFRFRFSRRYFLSMPDRLRHALRFAVTTLVAVYAIGVAWELLDVFVRGDVAEGLTARQTFAFNEDVWRVIAAVEGLTVFLLRIGDLNDRPPSWGFAWGLAAWLGASSVLVAAALEGGEWVLAAGVAVAAGAIWLWLHRRLPGWPGSSAAGASPFQASASGEQPERELP